MLNTPGLVPKRDFVVFCMIKSLLCLISIPINEVLLLLDSRTCDCQSLSHHNFQALAHLCWENQRNIKLVVGEGFQVDAKT